MNTCNIDRPSGDLMNFTELQGLETEQDYGLGGDGSDYGLSEGELG